MRDHGAPALAGAFVERNDDDVVRPVTITPLNAPQSTLWPASVGPLKPRMLVIAERRSVEMRQTVELIGDTDKLPYVGLGERTTVLIPRYGEPAFQVYPDLCEYGAVRTKLTVVRQMITQLGNNHAPRSA